MPEYTEQLELDGYALVRGVIGPEGISELIDAVCAAAGTGRQRHGSVYAVRNLLERVPAAAELARSTAVRRLIEPLLGPHCFAVRGTLFDKVAEANWKVVWHQDLTIAVRGRLDVPGFGPWTIKEGIPHVQPPVSVLERIVAVRLHLDLCGDDNGPLRVIPGSHRNGRLSSSTIESWRRQGPERSITAGAGDVLLMRPLLLHASSSATMPGHRRIVHLEYAADQLPGDLEWRSC